MSVKCFTRLRRTPFDPRPEYVTSTKSVQFQGRCKVEQAICHALGAIRNKQKWAQKVLRPEVKNKWLHELKATCQSEVLEDTEYKWADIFTHVFKEAEHQARQVPCFYSGVDNVFASDDIVSESVSLELINLTRSLENVPNEKKDYHPNTNRQVLNLVHPSLYPLVCERTLVLPDTEAVSSRYDWPELVNKANDPKFKASTVPALKRAVEVKQDCCLNDRILNTETKFQWLPSIFTVAEHGSSVSINSYINNLQPEAHEKLYEVLEKIFCSMLPLLECTLAHLMDPFPQRVEVKFDETYEKYATPEIPTDYRPHEPKPKVSLSGKRLKVITKLAGIYLTPQSKDYDGGNWHVEGTKRENIVATILYYYDIDNITESKLDFRTAISTPVYAQNDAAGVRKMFGFSEYDPLVMDLGSIVALQGRAICFPNLFQHRVAPFSLADLAKNGHRKILAFFVVDPENDASVFATNVVAPQQRDWTLANKSISDLDCSRSESICKMSHKEALEYRLQLMKDRSVYSENTNDIMFNVKFNLCEH